MDRELEIEMMVITSGSLPFSRARLLWRPYT